MPQTDKKDFVVTVTRTDCKPPITTEYAIEAISAQQAEVLTFDSMLNRYMLARGDFKVDSVFPKNWVDLR